MGDDFYRSDDKTNFGSINKLVIPFGAELKAGDVDELEAVKPAGTMSSAARGRYVTDRAEMYHKQFHTTIVLCSCTKLVQELSQLFCHITFKVVLTFMQLNLDIALFCLIHHPFSRTVNCTA